MNKIISPLYQTIRDIYESDYSPLYQTIRLKLFLHCIKHGLKTKIYESV